MVSNILSQALDQTNKTNDPKQLCAIMNSNKKPQNGQAHCWFQFCPNTSNNDQNLKLPTRQTIKLRKEIPKEKRKNMI